MPKITPLQESLYDIVPSINNINPDEKYESLRNFANKKQLFAGQTALSEEVIQTLLLEPISDPETKSELTAMLSDPINLSALQNLVTDHSEHINHLLYGYKKLKTILRIEQKIAEHQTALDQLNMSQYVS
ncbi:MAG: hypothetical protein LBD11_03860 [Candidatus Peribacteria bacterium]|jgi:hypothetical protein|nr:hypothetical protein [Candidatus Peribacteria bacterium]